MIHVLATVETVEGKRQEFLSHFEQVVPKVRAETGCIEYGAAIDVQTSLPAQPHARENSVTVIEKWENIEALEDHLVAPHMLEYRGTIKSLVKATELLILKPVSP